MANLPISQLPSASVPSGSGVLPIVQGGVTDQITVTNLGKGIFNLGLPVTASTISQTDYIDFNTGSATPAWKSGRVFWDNTDGCLAVYNVEQDVTLQVGQENWTRVFNGTGLTIANGSPVRITGTHGDVPEVVLAQSVAVSGSANLVNQILGVATHTIETGTYGYITTQGLVRGLNTNAYNDGDTLYVSQTAGQYVTTQPPAPYEIIPVGQVVKASPGASGIIYVAVQQPIDFSDLSTVRRTGVDYAVGDIWTFQPSASFNVWVHGKQLTGSYGVTGSWDVRGPISVGNISGSVNTENTFNVFPPLAGGVGEGGQILIAASGGLYTSASMIDVYQNQFRILKGTNSGGSTAGYFAMNLDNGNSQFIGALTASAYSGLPNDYLYATRSGSNQTVGSAWANTDVIFNNVVVSKGISFNTSTGIASLTGGKVYRVTARLAWSAAASYNLQFSCYTSANTKIGPDVEIVQSSNGTSNISDGTLEFIYAPSGNTDIKIRCTANNTALSGEQIRYDLNTQFIIQQIA